MKKVISILSVAAVLMVLFVSCSKDNDDPNRPASVTATKEYTLDFMIGANQPTSTSLTMNLSDFTELANYVKYVNKGTINLATSTLTITGITDGTYELKDAKLATQDVKTNGTLSFGTLTADKTITTVEDANYMQTTVNKMISSNKATVTFSIASSNKDVARTIKVKIKLNVLFALS